MPALFIAASAAWFYAIIAGFAAPVVRAAAGYSLFVIASYFFRRTRVLNILAFIAIVYLLLDPDQLFDPGFQLSFLSVAAIGALAMPMMERFTVPMRQAVKRFDQVSYDPQVELRAAQWRVELRLLAQTVQSWTGLREKRAQWIVANCTRLSAFVADSFILSACIQFGAALPMIIYFHRISVTGLIANALVVPLLLLVIPFGFRGHDHRIAHAGRLHRASLALVRNAGSLARAF